MAGPATLTKNGKVEIVTGSESFGKSFVSVLVKRSFRIVPGEAAQRLDEDYPLRMVDQYYDGGEPQNATVEHEFEVAPIKAMTDVVIVGNAYAPQARPCHKLTIGATIGKVKTDLRITGDRICNYVPGSAPRFSDPTPFIQMPLRYERAYGGKDHRSIPELPFWYPRNDMGVGVALSNSRDVIEGLRLPNIEHADDLLTPERVVIGEPEHWHRQPIPMGFGWRQRTWFPRCALIGSCPPFLEVGTHTAEEKMGLLPANYVALARQFKLKASPAQFANGASIGLSFDNLPANESILLSGLTPNGQLSFLLPGESPSIALNIGKGLQPVESRLFTISIRPDDLELDMIWGGVHSIGEFREWSKVTRLEAEVN